VQFERKRKHSKEGTALDEYEVAPTWAVPVQTTFVNYCEYALELLARGHDRETGTIRITMTSRAAHPLTEVTIVFDSRAAEPVVSVCKGLKGYRLLRALRTKEERDVLQGRYALSVERETQRVGTPQAALEQEGSSQHVVLPELTRGSLF
jgi:hypothetical protein